VRPLWKSKLTKPGLAELFPKTSKKMLTSLYSAAGLQQSNVADSMLVTVQKNLYALKDFLDKNPHLFHSSPGEPTVSRTPAGHEQEAWKVCFSPDVE
jgi:nuclear pore complex protein Nup155